MRVIIAPDSYKGSVSALEVARAMQRGVQTVFPHAEIQLVPIADGGEGTVEAMVASTGGTVVKKSVQGPLGTSVEAYYGLLGDKVTAVIEMAAASGLPLVPKAQRDPRGTTTYGTGELIKAALDAGAKRLVIGIGGSATNDGGAGMLQALGVRFLDAAGQELPPGGAALAKLASIDMSGLDARLAQTDILVACDVDNPLCGPRGASAVYGPQKGATPAIVQELDAALVRYARVAQEVTGKDAAEIAGAGAAGGLGAGFLFFTEGRLCPGVDVVLETANFEEMVKQADLVLTGEGCTDYQTAYGKAPVGVSTLARAYGVPCICLSGGLGEGCSAVREKGIDALSSTAPGPLSLEECMERGAELIEEAAERVCRLLAVGMNLKNR